MDRFDARSPEELDRELRANDVRVPGRTQGRTTAHTETWVACRFLATIAGTDLLQFPVRVEPGDRPDLVLSGPEEKIGIELTEAISTDQAKVDAMVEREGEAGFRSIPRYRVSDPARSQSEIRALALGQSQILPRMGESVERDWVEAMLYIVARKAAVFFKPGFAQHPANWLLVYDNWQLYDNWQPIAGLHESLAAARLNEELSGSGWRYPFCKVFVQKPRRIWQFCDGSRPIGHWIPETWLDR